jgi:hypothetical protein
MDNSQNIIKIFDNLLLTQKLNHDEQYTKHALEYFDILFAKYFYYKYSQNDEIKNIIKELLEIIPTCSFNTSDNIFVKSDTNNITDNIIEYCAKIFYYTLLTINMDNLNYNDSKIYKYINNISKTYSLEHMFIPQSKIPVHFHNIDFSFGRGVEPAFALEPMVYVYCIVNDKKNFFNNTNHIIQIINHDVIKKIILLLCKIYSLNIEENNITVTGPSNYCVTIGSKLNYISINFLPYIGNNSDNLFEQFCILVKPILNFILKIKNQ